MESFSCDLREMEKEKNLYVFFHCHLTPIICEVITLPGFTHSFHALCGFVVVALKCGLIIVLVYPLNTQLKHQQQTYRPQDSRQSQM